MSSKDHEREEVWLQNPKYLFWSISIIPTQDMSYPARVNALTRLFILIVILVVLTKWVDWRILACIFFFVIVWSCFVITGRGDSPSPPSNSTDSSSSNGKTEVVDACREGVVTQFVTVDSSGSTQTKVETVEQPGKSFFTNSTGSRSGYKIISKR